MRILAAGAARYAAQPPLSLALVVWSATPVDGGPPFDAWEASFVFLAPGRDGGFTPVDPSTVASWEAPPGLGQPLGPLTDGVEQQHGRRRRGGVERVDPAGPGHGDDDLLVRRREPVGRQAPVLRPDDERRRPRERQSQYGRVPPGPAA